MNVKNAFLFVFMIVTIPMAACPDSNLTVPFRHIIIDRDFPRYPHCKTVGDIDGDGQIDVLAASAFGQGLYWYRYPNWTKHCIDLGAYTTDMQTGDVDGDGDLDVIIPKDGTGMVWYENPRPGGNPASDRWTLHKIDSEGGHDVEVGDVDHDGRLDVVVRKGQTRVFLQESPNSWHRIAIPTGGRGGTCLGDLDKDGDLDIAENGYWLETPANKNDEWKRHDIDEGWPDDCGVHLADLNEDGRLDVLMVPAESDGNLVWFETENVKDGPWIKHIIESNVTHIHTFKTADIDRDGDLDVITAEMEQSPLRRVTIHYNLGKALQWKNEIIGHSGSHNLRVADIGNDGDIDIVGANHGNYGGDTPIDMWENLTNHPEPSLALDRWKRHVIDPKKPWGAAFIHAGDLDNDGDRDIVTGGWWYRNPNSPNEEWKRMTIGEPLNDAVLVADLDQNGTLDILGTQGKTPQANSNFVWARNNGKGEFSILSNIAKAKGDFLQGCELAFTAYRKMEVVLSWHHADQGVQMLTVPKNPVEEQWPWRVITQESQDEAVSSDQIDGDNRVDLLLGTKWLGRKGNEWIVHTLNDTPGSPDRNRLADINQNGLPDAVVGFEAINIPGKLAWYEHPASAETSWPEHMIATVVGPMSVDVADMDRDGDIDVVVGEHNYDKPETAKLHIFENIDGYGETWKDHIVYTGDEHHDGAVVTDLDNDGDLDIISIGWKNTKVLFYENQAISLQK